MTPGLCPTGRYRPVFGERTGWTGALTAASTVSVFSLFGGLLAIVAEWSTVLAFVHVLGGTLLLGMAAVSLWKIGWPALDMAVGAYLIVVLIGVTPYTRSGHGYPLVGHPVYGGDQGRFLVSGPVVQGFYVGHCERQPEDG